MSLTFGYACIISILLTWFIAQYSLWRISEGHSFAPINTGLWMRLLMKLERILRREWYRSLFYIKHFFGRCTAIGIKIFVKIIPSAKSAFTKQDVFKGLEHGPSSYYLQSISESNDQPRRSHKEKKTI